jgi:hypothetical protein
LGFTAIIVLGPATAPAAVCRGYSNSFGTVFAYADDINSADIYLLVTSISYSQLTHQVPELKVVEYLQIALFGKRLFFVQSLPELIR